MDELEAIALAAAAKRKKQGQQYDEMGFPVQPAGGSSVNPQAVGEFKGSANALGTSVANGLSFGFGDNVAGVVGGVDNMLRGRDFKSGYDNTVQLVRDGMAYDNATKRGLTTAGNIAGAGIQGLLTAPFTGPRSVLGMVTKSPGILGTMARSGVVGGVEGGLHGAGNADGQDVVGQTIKGGLIGAGAGVAAPAVVGMAAGSWNAVKDPVTGVIDSLISRANTGKANRAVGAAIRSSGKTEQELIDAVTRAAREGQPEFRLMDALGIAGQRQASGVARAGGDAATEIQDFLTQRQLDQGDRVGSFIDDAFGTRGTTAAKTRDSLIKARDDAADVNYPAARGNAGPVNLSGTLEAIDDALRGVNSLDGGATGLAETAVGRKLASVRGQLESGDYATINFDEVLETKQELGRAIDALKSRGGKVPPAVAKVYGQLDAALENSSILYRKANDEFRSASRAIDAVDTGAGMAARGRAADNVPAFNALTAAEQDAARVGYGDLLLNRLEAVTSPTANRAKPLLSTKRTTEADAMALGPTIYRDRLNRENVMWETQNRALGGSRTADNTQDVAAMEGLAGGALDVARSAANFQVGDAIAKIGGMLGPIARGQTDETRQLIVRILMSDDPAKALAPVLRQQMLSDAKRRTVEALLRQPMRDAGLALGQ